MHKSYLLSCAAVATAVVVASTWAAPSSSKQNSAKSPASATQQESDPRREVILRRAKAFMDAYNAQDAQKVASLFSANAEMADGDDVTRGRKEIKQLFASVFKASPKARISLSVDSIRFVASTVAIEEGRLTSFPDGKTGSHESRYQVVHARTNGEWRVAHARTLETVTLSHHEHLKELEWMIGHWVDEGEESVVETTCRWSTDKNFLLREFKAKIDGQPAISGVQRIGWDPLTKQFKSWVFDSAGGYAEGLWSNVGDNWVVKARGVRHDGTIVSSTNQFTFLGKDKMQWVSVHRMAGNEQLPNLSATIVRKPPKPSK